MALGFKRPAVRWARHSRLKRERGRVDAPEDMHLRAADPGRTGRTERRLVDGVRPLHAAGAGQAAEERLSYPGYSIANVTVTLAPIFCVPSSIGVSAATVDRCA